jgi:hypothetical protein
VQRRVFVLKRKELRDGWRKLHSDKGKPAVIVAVSLNLIFWDITLYNTEEISQKKRYHFSDDWHHISRVS